MALASAYSKLFTEFDYSAQGIKNKAKSLILGGNDIFCCFPRRAGKTELVNEVLEVLCVEKRIAVCISVLSLQTHYTQSKNIIFFSPKSTDRLRGSDIDCMILDEFAYIKDDCLIEILAYKEIFNCQFVAVTSPDFYYSEKASMAKKLWDAYPAVKFQMSGSLSNYEDRESFKTMMTEEIYQTGIEGNWVAL
jgi:hypothetical protein